MARLLSYCAFWPCLVIPLNLVHTLLWGDRRHLVRKRLQMDGPVVEPDAAAVIEPGQGVLEPILIVPLGEVFARVGAAAFCPANRRMQADGRLPEHVVELERLG